MKCMAKIVFGLSAVCMGAMLFCASASAYTVELVARSEAKLSRPHDLALDPKGERLYVTDMENDRIVVLDPLTLKLVSSFGNNELAKPHDLDFDAQGRLLVADTGHDRIVIYTADGKKIGEYTDRLSWTEGVASGPDGTVYATNVGDNSAVKLVEGRAKVRVTGSGGANGGFVRPHDIHVWNNTVYVADPGNNRVQLFDLELRPLRMVEAGFKEPKYMEVDKRGWLYVADQHNNVIKVFDEKDRPVFTFGAGELNLPEGVAVAGDRIWIADTYNDRVLLYTVRK